MTWKYLVMIVFEFLAGSQVMEFVGKI